jgi:UDP-N-acetylmuramate--alanine ligase
MPPSMDATLTSAKTESAASQFRGKRVHFIGVGGSGMSGLAHMLIDAGAFVSGSEPRPNAQTFELTKAGAKISRDQVGELLDRNIDLVVRTAAVPDSNLEFIAARGLGIRTVKYAQMLGMVMAERFGVAVAGTHGKSTTSAMISFALLQCGVDPSFVIGGTVPQLGGGSRSGNGNVFVAEACEFDRSFHNLHPKVAIITNIEGEHFDCYANINDIIASFHNFAKLVPPDGLIIGGGDDARVLAALEGITCQIESAGVADSPGRFAWTTRIVAIDGGNYRGEVFHNDRLLGTLQLSVAGRHNLTNATLAVAACVASGAEPAAAIEALGKFTGVNRRMTLVGSYNGATIVDDYGHHPTEIRVTLKALREKFSPRRLHCVFQPHQHSRTRFLLDDFAASFELADQILIPDIFFVRDSEAERQRVNSADLVQRLAARGQGALHLPEFSAIVDHLKKTVAPGDLVVTMGAGNVWEIGRELICE